MQLHSPQARNLRLFAIGATLALATTASAAQVWTAPAATKIRPQAAAPQGAPTSATIAAARNEFEAFQVVVNGSATGISLAFEGLSDGNGHTISGRDVVLYREALINLPAPSDSLGGAGWWPDALVPDVDPLVGEKRNAFPFDVPAGETRAVYVDVHVPQDAPAGTYTGNVIVSGSISATVPVTLTVWDFAIPSTSTLQSAFGITWNGPCMGHGDGGCTNVTYERELRARYVQAALDNHVSVYLPVSATPVAADGTADWSAYDTYAGPFFNGTANTRLKGAKLTGVEIYGSGTSAAVKTWSDHFKANGWYSTIFNYICDEPPATCAWSDIPGRIAASRTGDSNLTTLVTTQPYTAASNGVTGIDRYVGVINFMESPSGGVDRARWPANIWLYQGCMSFGCGSGGSTAWPSYAIDTDAGRNRALEWMSYIFDASGELYYEMTMGYFGGDPWVDQTDFGGNGDGTLFYPGTTAKIGGQTEIPVESLRLKGIRDGMEDYELLHLAASLGLGAQAKQIALGVYPHAYQASASAASIDSARAHLAALILHAMGKDTTQPPPTDPGPGTTGTGGSGTTPPPATTPGSTATFSNGGCSSTGPQSVGWLVLAICALFAGRLYRRTTR